MDMEDLCDMGTTIYSPYPRVFTGLCKSYARFPPLYLRIPIFVSPLSSWEEHGAPFPRQRLVIEPTVNQNSLKMKGSNIR